MGVVSVAYKKYSSKKYEDYTVIVDNDNDVELTLDSVVDLLNRNTWDLSMYSNERERLINRIDYLIDNHKEIDKKYGQLKYLCFFMILIIIIETYMIIGGI